MPSPCLAVDCIHIGQTELCVNDHLRDYAQNVSKKGYKGAHIIAHVNACVCEAHFSETMVLDKTGNTFSGVTLEANFIKNRGIFV